MTSDIKSPPEADPPLAEKVQVNKSHYHGDQYDDLERFISYYYQIDLTRSLQPQTLLEIGVGNGLVSGYFKKSGIEVTTCDIDSSLSPDYIGDIRELPFPNDSFDAVMACEVLEHIPFEDFSKALGEIHRVTKEFAVISLPYRHTSLQVAMKFPLVRTLARKSFIDFCLRIPLRFKGFESSGQHYWEIDRSQYPLKKIRERIGEHFTVKRETRPALDSYHEFFVLEKKNI